MDENIYLSRAEIVWLYENVGEGQNVLIEPDLGREFRIYPVTAIEDGKIKRSARTFNVTRNGRLTD
jgi:hypothetical protein